MHKFALVNGTIMNIKIKQQLQDREFQALKGKKHVILKWATGCGKSKMTIDLMNHVADHRINVLLVVAEKAHIDNWKEEFSKWKLNKRNISVKIICYASLKKLPDTSWDIIVFDEAHHLFTEKRMEVVATMNAESVYILSATLSSSKIQMAEELFKKRFITSTVTLKEAIKKEVLPDPKVYVIGMDLDTESNTEEIVIGSISNPPIVRWEDRGKYIYKSRPCIIRCTERQKYIFYTDSMEYWKRRYQASHNEYQHNIWKNLGSKRKRYLGELKTNKVKELISLLPKRRRFVCFCTSIAQAELLKASNTISSKKPDKLNQKIIKAFNDGLIRQIFAVGMITEGMNLTDIQAGIIVQLDGKERLFIQKAGRVMRADSPAIYIFYYKDTQDEVYLKQALENIDHKFVQHVDINHLKTIKL